MGEKGIFFALYLAKGSAYPCYMNVLVLPIFILTPKVLPDWKDCRLILHAHLKDPNPLNKHKATHYVISWYSWCWEPLALSYHYQIYSRDHGKMSLAMRRVRNLPSFPVKNPNGNVNEWKRTDSRCSLEWVPGFSNPAFISGTNYSLRPPVPGSAKGSAKLCIGLCGIGSPLSHQVLPTMSIKQAPF